MRKYILFFLCLVLGVGTYVSIGTVRILKARAYQAGYRSGQDADLKWKLATSTSLYLAADAGDCAKVKRELGIIVFAVSKKYETVFPAEAKSNNWKLYRESKRISEVVGTNLVMVDPTEPKR